MQHFSLLGPPGATRRRGWLALLWLLCCGTAAMAQPTYCSTNLGAYCGTGNANISSVAVINTPLNNPNTVCNATTGYTLFPTTGSTTGTLLRGLTYQVSVITPEAGIISVWFDWDQNGTFDASEWTQVATASTAGQAATVGVTVPTTAVLGLTGMRVRSRLSGNTNGAADACSLFGSGETEDYTVTIGAAPSCAPPVSLAAANITTTGATLTFSGATNGTATNYIVQYGLSGFTPGGTGSTTVNNTTQSVAVSGLTANTTYQFYVTKDCGGGTTSQTAGPFTFRTACVTPTYAALPVSESFETTWVGICDTQDAPTAFWRNTPVTGNNSWRRDDDGASAAWTSPTLGVYAPTGSQGTHSARFHSYYAGAAAVGFLDLYVNLSAAGNKVLQFDYLNTTGIDSLQVQVSTDGGSTFGAPLLRLGVSGTVAQGWQPQNVSVTSTSATTVVRFRTKVTTTFTSDIGLDNVRLNLLTGVPTCATNFLPAAGATNQARNTSLSWQAGTGVVTGYDVYFGTTATPPLVSTNQVGTTYTAPALLAASTTYYYQVIPRNANGPAVGCGVQSFTTNNVPIYCNPSTTFLSGFCGANNITDVTVAGSGLTATGLTCNAVVTSLGSSAYTSYPVSGTTTGTLLRGLTYPITVNNNGSSILSVWVDWNQNGTFEATEWTQIATTTTANTAVTVNITVPSTAALGLTGLRVRSRGTGNINGAIDACTTFGGGETKDFVVTIGAAPACAPAAGLTATNITTTGATLSFSTATNGTATNYIVQYGLSGFTPGGTGSTTANTTTTSTTIVGLTANTTYQFYVTKDCGGGTTSQIAGPFTFRTACVAPTYAALPVIESFENTWVGICDTQDAPTAFWRNTPMTGNSSWRRDDDGASAAWTSPTVGVYTPTGSQGTHSARFHSYYAGAGAVGTLDLFVNLSAAGAKRMSFDYLNTTGVDSLYVQVSTDGGNTFGTPLVGLGVSGTVAQGWQTQVLNLTGTSATTVVRFRTKVVTTFTSDIGVDNLRIELAAGCLSPANLTSTTTQTTATLSWLNSGSGTYTVVYGPTGFNPATGGTTVTGITGTSTTITGLTPSTPYQFYVTQNCAAGVSSGQAGPAAFSTSIPNDDCAGAINAPVQFGTCVIQTSADNTAATASTGVPAPGCANYVGQDVWFKVTVPASGTFTVETVPPTAGSPITDTGLAIYTGACSTLALLSCDDDTSPNGLFSLLTVTGRTPGEIVYIRVWAYGSNNSGLLAICVTSPSNCAVPTAPTSSNLTNTTATLSWVAGGTPTAGTTYELEYGLQGFTQGTGTSITGLTTTTRVITGLLPSTAYCYYVRQNCGTTNGSSAWVGPTCFTTPLTAPANDEPCGAVGLGTVTLTNSNVGATTSAQNGINLPACSSAQLPKDVWFTMTPTGTSATLTLTGAPAGMVRIFTSPSCSAGPFTQVFCASTGANNTAFTAPVSVTGLTAGTRYYVAVSGYGSSDTAGSFTLGGTGLAVVTATLTKADTNALLVYPNPSNTGQLTLHLNGLGGAGQATLLNALGQVVLSKALSGTAEQTLSTRGLAAGLYTLRVAVSGQVLTRKVVLE